MLPTTASSAQFKTASMHKYSTSPGRKLAVFFLLSVLLGAAPISQANPQHADNRILAGWVEKLALKATGDQVKAKLDTGAKTSSINATDIKRFKRDGKSWIRFTLEYETVRDEKRSKTLERLIRRNILVKEHEGENDRRAVVDLEFCFAGQWHSTQFSLVDRSKFVYPVLLGRRFLQEATLIDPASTFLTQPSCTTTEDNA